MSDGTVDTAQAVALWADMETAFAQFLEAHAAGKVVPLLEGDVAGYLYYLLVANKGGNANKIHLSTRVEGTDGREKYDLVVGDVIETETLKRLFIERAGNQLDESLRRLLLSRSVRSGFRPAVRGELVLEFKHFAKGFDPQQLRVHAEQVMDDLRKLMQLIQLCPDGRGSVLFDEARFLRRHWLAKILEARNVGDSRLRLYLFEPDNHGRLGWSRL